MGADKDAICASLAHPVSERWPDGELAPAIATIAAGSFKEKQPPDIRGTGYVVESLEAALWAFWRTDNSHDGALAAANLGDDADTTAAIYGQLAGAYYGAEGLPKGWVDRLAFVELIRQQADQLATSRHMSFIAPSQCQTVTLRSDARN